MANAYIFTQSLRAPETATKLHSWFSRYGNSAEVEIEARVKDVDQHKWMHLLRQLSSNKHWSVPPVTIKSSDVLHASGVRESRGGPEGTCFMRKNRIDTFEVYGSETHHPVRLQASSEKPVAQDVTPISMVRHKKRHTFVHKGLFKFELTEVRAGPSWETALANDSEYEVEVEYCGQRAFKQDKPHVAYLVESFIGKARASPPARRTREYAGRCDARASRDSAVPPEPPVHTRSRAGLLGRVPSPPICARLAPRPP
jgi:hypothetical protein